MGVFPLWKFHRSLFQFQATWTALQDVFLMGILETWMNLQCTKLGYNNPVVCHGKLVIPLEVNGWYGSSKEKEEDTAHAVTSVSHSPLFSLTSTLSNKSSFHEGSATIGAPRVERVLVKTVKSIKAPYLQNFFIDFYPLLTALQGKGAPTILQKEREIGDKKFFGPKFS